MPKSEAKTSSRSVQDYLRALGFLLSSTDRKDVSTGGLARYLGVAPASVTEMLKKLTEDGFVVYSPYHGTALTPKGLREAQRVIRKHRLLERFLFDVLQIPKDRVHSQACEMEHALSDEAEKSMCRLLKHPDRCPDDDQVIPACDLSLSNCEQCAEAGRRGKLELVGRRKENLIPLCSLKAGTSGRVYFIRGEQRFLHRIQSIGLAAGALVRMERVTPPNGPAEVSIRGLNVVVGRDIAESVFVGIAGERRG